MSLIQSIQSISSPIITGFLSIVNYLSSMPMLIFIIALVFIFIGEKQAFKMGLSYMSTFFLCGILLNNIVPSNQPYKNNETLLAMREEFSFGSFPSSKLANVAGVGTFFSLHYSKNKKHFVCALIFAILACLLVGLCQLYYAQNYLLDLVVGVAIGILIYALIYKFLKINNYKWYLFALVLPLVLLFIFVGEWGQSVGHLSVFSFCGFSCGLIIFCFLQDKFVKYKVKNNLIFGLLKLFVTTFVLILYYLFCKYLFSSCMILVFLSYFFAMGIVCFCLPLIFKKLEKYFYVFDKEVDLEKVVFSKVVLSTNGTKKVALQIKNLLKKGEIVILKGDLGAGKTQLTRYILQDFGVNNAITSPTFTILNEYDVKNDKFYHFDMYRLDDESEIENIGYEEILEDKKAYKFIEWAEKIPNYLPKHYYKISIVKMGKNSRNIVVEKI